MFYKMKKNVIALAILCTLGASAVFAISPTGSVTSIGQSSDVGNSIYPVSINVNYGVYDFPLLKDMPLRFTVALSGGYSTHYITQNSTDGEFGWDGGTTRTYGTIFSTYSFKLTQPLRVPFDLPGSLTTYASFDCRYERPVTTASYFGSLTAGDSFSSTFTDTDGKLLDIFSSPDGLIGTPELNGNMYLRAFSFVGGLSYSNTINGYYYRISNKAILAPEIGNMNAGGDIYGGESEYFRLSTSLYVKKDIYGMKYNAFGVGSGARLFNLYICDSLSYRYLNGDKVPMFAQNYSNLRHGVGNTLALHLDGPQFLTADTYPSAYISYVDNFQWGALNNCTTGYEYPSTSVFSHYYKAYFDMRVIGIIHFSTDYTWNLDQDSMFSGSGSYSGFSFWVNI
jgi:hypothetical protein